MVEEIRHDAAAPFRPVTTTRLILRCAREEDRHALAALMTPGISARLASWPTRLTATAARHRIREARRLAELGRAVPLVMERRRDRALLGWFSATCIAEDPAIASLTYWLGEHFQGEGLMREAAPAALALAFGLLRLRRVRAAVQGNNDPSLAIVRQLGMHPMGPGRIWCAARKREEDCLWFDLAREEARLPVLIAAE